MTATTPMTLGELLDLVSREASVTMSPVPFSATIALPNDWRVSIAWHSNAYSSYRFDPSPPSHFGEISGTVEVALFDAQGRWHLCPESDSVQTQVFGWIDALMLHQVIDRVAAMPDGSCPCPDCIARVIKLQTTA